MEASLIGVDHKLDWPVCQLFQVVCCHGRHTEEQMFFHLYIFCCLGDKIVILFAGHLNVTFVTVLSPNLTLGEITQAIDET